MADETDGEQDTRYRPATFREAYPGRFLAAADIGDHKPTVRIVDVWREELRGEKGKEHRTIVAFEGRQKQWVMPKLCATAMVAMFGSRVADWIGKRIVLYSTAALMPMPPKRRGDSPDPCLRVWGSPDIDRDVTCEFAPPQRKALKFTLRATGKRAPETPAEPPQADPDGDKPF